MDHDFWRQRWRDNLIGFHQTEVNPHLLRYGSRLDSHPQTAVLVPLCGKSLDMVWLAQRRPVLGVELSVTAVEDFFREQVLPATRRRDGAFDVYQANNLSLYCGDFFALQAPRSAPLGAVYDRAALIALPPAMRPAYAAKLGALAAPGARMLLVTLEYPQAQMDGPPFSVEAAEVEALFAADWRIESLQQESILEREVRFRQRGLSRLVEHVYLLQK